MAWSKEGWTGAGLERLREGGVESPIELCTVEHPSFEDLFPSMLVQVDESLGRNKCLNERSLHITRFSRYAGLDGIWILELKGHLSHRLEILGVEEKTEEALWPDQLRFRRIAELQQDSFSDKCGWRTVGTQSGAHEHGPERPDWSNGAQIFLEPKHAEKLRRC